MRGTVAKRIRREVYQDQSIRQRRRYGWSGSTPAKSRFIGAGTIVNVGLRQEYQDAKKDYMTGER